MKKIIFLCAVFLLTTQVLLAQEVLKSGKWDKIGYKVAGTWSIVKKTDANYLVLDKSFKTSSGPDLYLLFTNIPTADLTNSNASSNSKIIAKLQSNKGYQEYKIPDTLDWKEHPAIVIHCVRFSHLWASANLTL